MKKLKKLLRLNLILALLAMTFTSIGQVPLTPGNIVIYCAGDGTVDLSLASGNAYPAFLREYTPTGVLVQSIPLPIAVNGTNKICTMGGSTSHGGWVTRSRNGQYLVFTGYNGVPGTANITIGNGLERVIGLIDYNAIINTSTALTDYAPSSRAHSAISTNGTDLWAVGEGTTTFVRYATIGSTTSTDLTSVPPAANFAVNITDGQLYTSTGSSTNVRIGAIGSGIPTTSGQAYNGLPGMPTTGQFYQFNFVDLDASVSGPDVLYIANASAGIQKYSLVGGVWTLNGTVGASTDAYRGLTTVVAGSNVIIYASRRGANTSTVAGGDVVTLTDASGYNGVFSGTPTVFGTAPGAANTYSFRGIAIAPEQTTSVKASTKIFLQGAYNSGLGRHKDVSTTWASVLNTKALNQPYNVAPFNYSGTESVSSGFFTSTAATTDILDWVLVELRDETTPATVIARRAVFVREDGQLVDLDGTSPVSFPGVNNGRYYVVIRHRNHLSIRSATPIVFSSGVAMSYVDFGKGQPQAFQDGTITSNAALKDLDGGITFSMWGGNANSNTNVRFTGLNNDAGIILSALGGNQAAILSSAYNNADLNMDGTVRYTGLNNDAGSLLSVLGSNQAAIFTQHQ